MAKEKTVYVCSNCGQESPKWVGKCPSCGQWNTFVEEIVRKEPSSARRIAASMETAETRPMPIDEIRADEEPRIDLHDQELNRVLGGGLVRGSLVLSGAPGNSNCGQTACPTLRAIASSRVKHLWNKSIRTSKTSALIWWS